MKNCNLFLLMLALGFGCSSGEESISTDLAERLTRLQKLDSHRHYDPGELRQDLDVIRTSLEEAHGGLYDWSSKEILDNRFAEMQHVVNLPEGVNYLTWLDQIARLTVEIGDAQTTWGHNPNYIQFRNENIPLAPFEMERKDGGWYLKRDFTFDRRLPIGEELFSINGLPLADYLSANRDLLPIQYDATSMQANWLQRAYPKHHTNFWEQPESYDLVFKDGQHLSAPSAKQEGLLSRGSEEVPWEEGLNYFSQENIYVLKIASLDQKDLERMTIDHTVFLEGVFRSLQGRPDSKLVLDIRGLNNGKVKQMIDLMSFLYGEPFTPLDTVIKTPVTTLTYHETAKATRMMSPQFLMKLQQPYDHSTYAHTGPVYVITDGGTSGTVGLLLAKLATRPETFFVGEQAPVPGWGIHHGQFILALPISQIRYTFPTTKFVVNREPIGKKSLVPLHHPIPYGPETITKTLALTSSSE